MTEAEQCVCAAGWVQLAGTGAGAQLCGTQEALGSPFHSGGIPRACRAPHTSTGHSALHKTSRGFWCSMEEVERVSECRNFSIFHVGSWKSYFVISAQLHHPREQLPVPAGSRDLLSSNSFIFSTPFIFSPFYLF